MEGNWNGANGANKYQYNDKEWNDDFGLGLNDYGARFYDPARGHWTSVDPMAAAFDEWSPYNYVEGNPMLHRDPNGLFLIPVHINITRLAIAQLKAQGIPFSNDDVEDMLGASVNTDIVGAVLDAHFDGRSNSTKIKETWNDLNQKKINSAWDLGRHLHTVQDFYAHSNYVELYVQYYQESGQDMSLFDPKTIPTYNEAMAANGVFAQNYLGNLHTGHFSLFYWLLGSDHARARKKKVIHHDHLNKDSAKKGNGAQNVAGTHFTWHDLAKEAATRETIQMLNKVIEQQNANQDEKERAKPKPTTPRGA
jgi:RHS repeat-associated protein